MASKFSRVNGRGHRTLSDKAKCTQCKNVYNTFKVLNDESVCYTCLGHTIESWDELRSAQFKAKYA